jgi:hypothetical protein
VLGRMLGSKVAEPPKRAASRGKEILRHTGC